MGKKDVIAIVLLSLGTGALSVFVEECKKEGMILHWYDKLLNYLWDNTKFPKWLLKPLGMCIYCYGSWLFIVLFLSTYNQFCGEIPIFIGLLIGLGFNFVSIKAFEKL